ncbi:MAG TPA: cation diffusion facilitator family transporter [Aquabacterium sp.]|nr:cation diffusion facilitator family transporter [Aquabacterium sp.]
MDLLEDDPELDSVERQQVARRSTLVSVVVNLILTTVQVAVGLQTRSQALVADGIHSLSDLVADFVVLIASRHSSKAADEDHHYGHHRYETAASLVLGLLLLFVGIGMLWSAVGKLREPETIAKVSSMALYVALFTLVAKELLFRYMLAGAERVRSSMLVANAWHARSDAASSLVVALGIGGNMLGYPLLDPVAALIVGFMVARMGWGFGWEALADLMDRSASDEHIAQIRTILLETPGVHGLHDLRTRRMGDMIVVDVHLEVDGDMTVARGHDIAVDARVRVMDRLPVLNVMTHLDPAAHKP